MPLSPDDLKSRYDRLSYRVEPGTKSMLVELASKDGIRPTEWLERTIEQAHWRQIGGAAIDASKGEWRCRCKPNREFDTSANPRNVSVCLKCGAMRPKKVKKEQERG